MRVSRKSTTSYENLEIFIWVIVGHVITLINKQIALVR
jgi:hypothetical protein